LCVPDVDKARVGQSLDLLHKLLEELGRMETVRSGNIQGTCREHSGNIQGTCREHSGNMQGNI
jgi:hypothetical protein